MSTLANKIFGGGESTLKKMLNAAEHSGEPYVFIDPDDRRSADVVPFPASLDDAAKTLRSLHGALVTIEAEEHRLANEKERLNDDIVRHTANLVKKLEENGLTVRLLLDYMEKQTELPESTP